MIRFAMPPLIRFSTFARSRRPRKSENSKRLLLSSAVCTKTRRKVSAYAERLSNAEHPTDSAADAAVAVTTLPPLKIDMLIMQRCADARYAAGEARRADDVHDARRGGDESR